MPMSGSRGCKICLPAMASDTPYLVYEGARCSLESAAAGVDVSYLHVLG